MVPNIGPSPPAGRSLGSSICCGAPPDDGRRARRRKVPRRQVVHIDAELVADPRRPRPPGAARVEGPEVEPAFAPRPGWSAERVGGSAHAAGPADPARWSGGDPSAGATAPRSAPGGAAGT